MEDRPDCLTPLANGKIATVHHPSGISEKEIFFDEAKTSQLIAEWRKSRDPALMSEIVLAALALIECVVRGGGYSLRSCFSFADFVGYCVAKTPRLVAEFDPALGKRVFAFFSRGYHNRCLHLLDYEKRRAKYFANSDAEGLGDYFAPEPVEQSFSPAFLAKLYRIPTRFPDFADLQRFIIDEFVRLNGKLVIGEMMRRIRRRHPEMFKSAVQTLLDYVLVQIRLLFADEYAMRRLDIRFLHRCGRDRSKGRRTRLLKIAEVLGPELFARVCFIFGGCQLKIPSPEDLTEIFALADLFRQETLTQEESSLVYNRSVRRYFNDAALRGLHETTPLNEIP